MSSKPTPANLSKYVQFFQQHYYIDTSQGTLGRFPHIPALHFQIRRPKMTLPSEIASLLPDNVSGKKKVVALSQDGSLNRMESMPIPA